VQSCLHVAAHQRYIDAKQFDRHYRQCASARRLCVALIGSLEGRRPPTREPEVREPEAPAYGVPSPVTGHRSPVTLQ
jgi:hypothetical protein